MNIKQRIITFCLCLSVALNIGAAYTIFKGNSDLDHSHTRISNLYEENLNIISSKCNEIEQGLCKLTVCSDREQAIRILSDIIDDSSAASISLTLLPISPEYTVILNRYFNHLSDYSKYMMYSSAEGCLPSESFAENISALHKSASGINSAISSLRSNPNPSAYDWSLYLRDEISELDMLSDDLFSTFETIQTESISYPTLIYDGPFSDSVVNRIINESANKNIDENEAERVFVKYLSVNVPYRSVGHYSCDGVVSTWCVVIEVSGKKYYGNVSKATGEVISFLCDNDSANQRYSRDDAVKAGSDFLSTHGYTDMEPQYCEITENIATINYVYTSSGILIYPDMVKIRVNLENGKVEGFEGLSYYANHRDRNISFEKTDISSLKLPNGCEITSSGPALIPTDGGNEQLCTEIRCIINGDSYILYFDAASHKEVKIFKVLSSENGDFVV